MTVAERVAKGVKYLNRYYPGWREKIVLKEFDMSRPCRCVLGMVAQEKAEQSTWATDGFEYEDGKHAPDWAMEHGFDIDGQLFDPDAYSELQAEWLRVLEEP